MFSGVDGTVWTSGNDGAASTLDAGLLDGIDSTQFLRSDASDQHTSGTLAVNGTFQVGESCDIHRIQI